jgi:transcriptional regulator with XRE-family HTH domain
MFRVARNAACLSREEAAQRLYIGSRTLADYESGRTIAPPDVVMRMSEVYQEPTLPADYCAKVCPIGQVLAHSIDRSEFAVTVLRVLKEFADVERLKDQLIQIAADGRICEKEVADFKEIMKEMIELERWIVELKYFAMRHGIDVEDIMPEKDKKITA